VNYDQLFSKFNNLRVLVIGDVMVDAYILGKVNRISPEAPVPVVSFEQEEKRIGGAGNVALNLVALGAQPIVCSVIGDDEQGQALSNLFTEKGISSQGIIISKDRKTTVKTRVIANKQQLLRIDSETTSPINESEENALLLQIQALISEGIDGIIFEDYNKGVLTESLIQQVITLAKAAGIPTTVDPKRDNFLSYQGVTLFKPNLKELKEGLNFTFDFKNEQHLFEKAVAVLEEKLKNTVSFITLSEFGVFIKEGNEKHYIAAHLRNIADVSGAGDTVIAVATLCLIAGASIADIAGISNVAGGLVCEQSGVVSISKEELIEEWRKISSN
jgi:rfaE bifunctional protein kinase chain/domain